ncbi:MAG: hypothetical protein U5L00_07245 [Desulfovermiculus sp.]|nr:hypothetical protein [Desulfovermiculus sp.]
MSKKLDKKEQDKIVFMYTRKIDETDVDILKLYSEGDLMKQVCDKIYLSEGAVKTRKKKIIKNLDAKTFLQAAVIAAREGII